MVIPKRFVRSVHLFNRMSEDYDYAISALRLLVKRARDDDLDMDEIQRAIEDGYHALQGEDYDRILTSLSLLEEQE